MRSISLNVLDNRTHQAARSSDEDLGRVARHDVDRVVQRKLAGHNKRLADKGVKDPGRLAVHGLSYLREIDSGRQPL
jgi:hypothetical protein